MAWADFWKSEDEKQFEEFLTNPKEVYEKLQNTFKELNDKIEIISNKSEVRLKEIERLEKEVSEFYDELDLERSLTKGALKDKEDSIIEFKANYQDLEIILTKRLEAEYKTKWLQKEAKLEKDYHHAVHEFIEEENEKTKELIPSIVREVIIGFHNEKE